MVSRLWLWTFWSHFDPQASTTSGGSVVAPGGEAGALKRTPWLSPSGGDSPAASLAQAGWRP